MKSELSDTLQAALEGYLRFFETTSSLGGAIFGAAIFLIVRAFGLVSDDGIAKIANVKLILAAGISGLAMVVAGFVAQNVSLNFSVELLRTTPFSGCKLPTDGEPATFFMNCHRKYLLVLVWIDLVAGFVGIFCIGVWFVLQTRRVPK